MKTSNVLRGVFLSTNYSYCGKISDWSAGRLACKRRASGVKVYIFTPYKFNALFRADALITEFIKSMKTSKLLFLLLLLFSFSNASAQREKPPTQAELNEITARGKMLYEYDVAAWHSTDAVMALSPPEGSIERYIARKTDKGWIVAYGKFNEKKDKFLIVYEAMQGAKSEEFKVQKLEKPREDAGFFLKAAKAHESAMNDFIKTNPPRRPYNFAVLPTDADEFFVYALPGQTKTGVFPLGGDIRYKISKEGAKILEKRQMHRSIIEFSVPPNAGKLETGYHTAILDDVPEDSDVFHVLTRTPKVPELIITNKFVYQIAPDGTIKYLTTREAFMKTGKQ
ncbi:MAG TPA: hypothetical protein VK892_19335 [Pyrinomonadaceae bacterium]|nr:hypothetical protein [Pyrinomonadaceae bacterium]